jgi:hypothetical protein
MLSDDQLARLRDIEAARRAICHAVQPALSGVYRAERAKGASKEQATMRRTRLAKQLYAQLLSRWKAVQALRAYTSHRSALAKLQETRQ